MASNAHSGSHRVLPDRTQRARKKPRKSTAEVTHSDDEAADVDSPGGAAPQVTTSGKAGIASSGQRSESTAQNQEDSTETPAPQERRQELPAGTTNSGTKHTSRDVLPAVSRRTSSKQSSRPGGSRTGRPEPGTTVASSATKSVVKEPVQKRKHRHDSPTELPASVAAQPASKPTGSMTKAEYLDHMATQYPHWDLGFCGDVRIVYHTRMKPSQVPEKYRLASSEYLEKQNKDFRIVAFSAFLASTGEEGGSARARLATTSNTGSRRRRGNAALNTPKKDQDPPPGNQDPLSQAPATHVPCIPLIQTKTIRTHLPAIAAICGGMPNVQLCRTALVNNPRVQQIMLIWTHAHNNQFWAGISPQRGIYFEHVYELLTEAPYAPLWVEIVGRTQRDAKFKYTKEIAEELETFVGGMKLSSKRRDALVMATVILALCDVFMQNPYTSEIAKPVKTMLVRGAKYYAKPPAERAPVSPLTALPDAYIEMAYLFAGSWSGKVKAQNKTALQKSTTLGGNAGISRAIFVYDPECEVDELESLLTNAGVSVGDTRTAKDRQNDDTHADQKLASARAYAEDFASRRTIAEAMTKLKNTEGVSGGEAHEARLASILAQCSQAAGDEPPKDRALPEALLTSVSPLYAEETFGEHGIPEELVPHVPGARKGSYRGTSTRAGEAVLASVQACTHEDDEEVSAKVSSRDILSEPAEAALLQQAASGIKGMAVPYVDDAIQDLFGGDATKLAFGRADSKGHRLSFQPHQLQAVDELLRRMFKAPLGGDPTAWYIRNPLASDPKTPPCPCQQKGAILGHGCGLGKTITALLFACLQAKEYLRRHPTGGQYCPIWVSAPSSLCANWVREYVDYFHADFAGLFMLAPHGAKPARAPGVGMLTKQQLAHGFRAKGGLFDSNDPDTARKIILTTPSTLVRRTLFPKHAYAAAFDQAKRGLARKEFDDFKGINDVPTDKQADYIVASLGVNAAGTGLHLHGPSVRDAQESSDDEQEIVDGEQRAFGTDTSAYRPSATERVPELYHSTVEGYAAVFIMDEAQILKHDSLLWTLSIDLIAPTFFLGLTATPMVNRCSDLTNLLRLCAGPDHQVAPRDTQNASYDAAVYNGYTAPHVDPNQLLNPKLFALFHVKRKPNAHFCSFILPGIYQVFMISANPGDKCEYRSGQAPYVIGKDMKLIHTRTMVLGLTKHERILTASSADAYLPLLAVSQMTPAQRRLRAKVAARSGFTLDDADDPSADIPAGLNFVAAKALSMTASFAPASLASKILAPPEHEHGAHLEDVVKAAAATDGGLSAFLSAALGPDTNVSGADLAALGTPALSVLTLLQHSAKLRGIVPIILEWIVKKDERVVFFCEFPLTCTLVALFLRLVGIKTSTIHSKMSMQERGRIIGDWGDPSSDTRALVSNSMLLGVGYNLHTGGCRVMVVVEPASSLALTWQELGRLHRLGVLKPQYAYLLYAEHTYDVRTFAANAMKFAPVELSCVREDIFKTAGADPHADVESTEVDKSAAIVKALSTATSESLSRLEHRLGFPRTRKIVDAQHAYLTNADLGIDHTGRILSDNDRRLSILRLQSLGLGHYARPLPYGDDFTSFNQDPQWLFAQRASLKRMYGRKAMEDIMRAINQDAPIASQAEMLFAQIDAHTPRGNPLAMNRGVVADDHAPSDVCLGCLMRNDSDCHGKCGMDESMRCGRCKKENAPALFCFRPCLRSLTMLNSWARRFMMPRMNFDVDIDRALPAFQRVHRSKFAPSVGEEFDRELEKRVKEYAQECPSCRASIEAARTPGPVPSDPDPPTTPGVPSSAPSTSHRPDSKSAKSTKAKSAKEVKSTKPAPRVPVGIPETIEEASRREIREALVREAKSKGQVLDPAAEGPAIQPGERHFTEKEVEWRHRLCLFTTEKDALKQRIAALKREQAKCTASLLKTPRGNRRKGAYYYQPNPDDPTVFKRTKAKGSRMDRVHDLGDKLKLRVKDAATRLVDLKERLTKNIEATKEWTSDPKWRKPDFDAAITEHIGSYNWRAARKDKLLENQAEGVAHHEFWAQYDSSEDETSSVHLHSDSENDADLRKAQAKRRRKFKRFRRHLAGEEDLSEDTSDVSFSDYPPLADLQPTDYESSDDDMDIDSPTSKPPVTPSKSAAPSDQAAVVVDDSSSDEDDATANDAKVALAAQFEEYEPAQESGNQDEDDQEDRVGKTAKEPATGQGDIESSGESSEESEIEPVVEVEEEPEMEAEEESEMEVEEEPEMEAEEGSSDESSESEKRPEKNPAMQSEQESEEAAESENEPAESEMDYEMATTTELEEEPEMESEEE